MAREESSLAAAGFLAYPADTPQRHVSLQRLPAGTLVMRASFGRPLYLYADPLVCGCLYIGPAIAYDRYRQTLAPGREAMPALIDPSWSLAPWQPGFGRSSRSNDEEHAA